ncbi:MAG: CHASE2 domain-containing protein [Candidatus Competibacter sp.]|nr:CHASE2 domain-containing protein [Candidatus Competibacter sp.]MDG4584521.1 CHASE2 domain-containing protein [Candidatus Competibacter sp.]
MSKLQSSSIWPATLVAGLALGLVIAFSNTSFFALLELKGLDLLFTLRGPLSPPDSIVIVAIDEPSMAEIKQQWPWPRSLHARLIQQLHQAGAAVIGFDILFAEPSEPAEDQVLAQALRESGNGVLASALSVVNDPLFRHTIRIDPIPTLRDSTLVGGAFIGIDPDGVVRRARLLAPDLPSFALQVVRRYLERPTAVAPERPLLSQRDLLREQPIDYRGPPNTIQTVSYYQALDPQHLLPPGMFADKIVLVGRVLEAIPEPQRLSGDTFLTPFSWTSGNPAAGVEIQATLVDNLLHGRFVAEPTPAEHGLGLLALALIASLSVARLKPLAALIATAVLATLCLAIAWAAFAAASLWLPLLPAIMTLVLVYGGHLLLRALTAERDRRRLLEAINRDLEAKIAERTQELAAANQELGQRHRQLETAYQDLTHTQQQLVQSEKMASLGQLVAGVAHELNNPTSYVHGNLDLIEEYTEHLAGLLEAQAGEDGSDSPARHQGGEPNQESDVADTLNILRELTASCKEGTKRIGKIVLDLRVFSRTDDVGLIPTDLHEGIESTLKLLTKQYQNRITIHRDYRPLPEVECLPGQINQVFMNLLQNAAQAIPGKGNVWIATHTEGAWVRIAIRDDGAGIAAEHLSKVFDPFFTTKPVGAGTGLGLSISYGIVEKHGGKIRVASTLHEGSEFTVELPVRPIGRTA